MRLAARATGVVAGIGLLVVAGAVNRPLPALAAAFVGLALIGTTLERRA